MAENPHFDATFWQIGVAFGFAAGTAVGVSWGHLLYWMVFGALLGFVIAVAIKPHGNDEESSH